MSWALLIIVVSLVEVLQANNSLLPNRTVCGIDGKDRILGGTATDYYDFPWLAMLQYMHLTKGGITFSCGGALINPRYVLTAAHCVTGRIAQKVGPLVSVRLGEYDIRTSQDCTEMFGITDCNQEPLNIAVEEVIPHIGYDDNSKNRYNDIALVRLVTDVEYTDFIKPICLPIKERAQMGEQMWAAGWGGTETAKYSPIKLKVALPIANYSDCRDKYRTAGIFVDTTQLCAGGSRTKDTCRGDSGGPLMGLIGAEKSQWYAEGIVSFGTSCGVEDWPGVYTRVSSYLGWISNNVLL